MGGRGASSRCETSSTSHVSPRAIVAEPLNFRPLDAPTRRCTVNTAVTDDLSYVTGLLMETADRSSKGDACQTPGWQLAMH